MLRDPRDIVARASGGEHDGGETPAHCGRLEEDRIFGAKELRIGSGTPSRILFILSIKTSSHLNSAWLA